jgi:uncharacterized protein (TIGR03067 family)
VADISLVIDGKTLVDQKAPPKSGPTTKLVYEADKWMAKVGDKKLATGKFKIEATQNPKTIDIMDESGVTNAKTKLGIFELGIFELDGDTYKYCLAPAGKPRPRAFSTKPGSGHALGVNKRARP